MKWYMFKNVLDAKLNNQEDKTDYTEYDELIKNINAKIIISIIMDLCPADINLISSKIE